MSPKAVTPVFFDPNGRRARKVRWISQVGLAAFVLISAAYITGVVIAPDLPVLQLASDVPVKAAAADSGPTEGASHRPRISAGFRSLPPTAAKARRYAFHILGDEASTSQLRRHAESMDIVVTDLMDWSETSEGLAVQVDPKSSELLRWMRRHAAQAEVFARISNDPVSARLAPTLASPPARDRLATTIARQLADIGVRGFVADFRALPSSSHVHLVKFLQQLRRELAVSGASLSLIVPRGTPPNRMRELGLVTDHLMVHLVLGHGELPRGGALAPQDWFEQELARHLAAIPPEKVVVAISAGATEWNDVGEYRTHSIQAAWDIARRHSSRIDLDAASLNPSFSYIGADGRRRQVWLLDSVTAFNQARAALAAGVGGIAIQQLGFEDPGVWYAIGRGRLPVDSVVPELERPRAAHDAYGHLKYDVLRSAPGSDGRREVRLSQSTGLITAARMIEPPVLQQFSGLSAIDPKAVALTFDDGPDPHVTPRILDILAEKGVKATFYIVGTNAARHPEIVRRIYAEGHDIGNHSYSHPDMMKLGRQEIARDLNSVQRLLESEVGINTVLFRAPYAMAMYREFVIAPQLISTVSELGYLVGGIRVDTFDYGPMRTASEVHRRTVQEVTRSQEAATVLMHDAGGPRSATIGALGPIIDDLKLRGYRFVTTHELVGLPRDSIMPLHAPTSVLAAAGTQVRGQYMVTFAHAADFLGQLAIGAVILAMLRLVLVIILAHIQHRRERRRASLSWRPRSVAVLVPGFNEEKVICKTVQSLLGSTIAERLEIIVIDDGSTDRTSEVVKETFAGDARVRVFKKPNGGKSAALNFGIEATSAEIVVAIDADTMLEPDAIELLVRHFHDPRLGAVAGNAVVGNQCNMITRMQALEYVTSQSLERRAMEIFNAIAVVPGAIGAWRRQALIEAGGYGHDTLAEDADLTIELERRGWKVIYEPNARALTEAPETVRAFLKQRFRWMFGTLQVAWKNLLNPRGLPLGIALTFVPNVLLFSFAFTLIAPLVDALLVASLVTIGLGLLADGSTVGSLGTLGRIGVFWLIFQTVDVLVAWLGVRLDRDRGNLWLLPWVVLQRFTYRQLLYWVAIRALLAAFRGSFVGWGKLLRTGTVILPRARRRDDTVPRQI
ncbi:MAG: glycosyltransferase [Hyphomicrobiaceae bacterium]|nr:glycosyltransferase [Hyphomicrobiaceae bacterium]